MSTLDELLSSSEALSDIDELILVDPVARELLIPTDELILGVAGDKRSECKYFKMPKVVGNGVDVTTCSLRIIYTNAIGEEDYFIVTDVVHDIDSVVFCWEISEKVARYSGDVTFSVCVCKVTEHDDAEKEWHTTEAVGKVLVGKCLNGASTDGTGSTLDVIGRMETLVDTAAQYAEDAREAADRALNGGGSGGGTGDAVADGATFTPAVAEDGTLSWTNDKGLDNPAPVNIKGPKGDTPVKGTDYFTATDKTEMVNSVLAALPTWTGGSY